MVKRLVLATSAVIGGLIVSQAVFAADARVIEVTIQDHRFTPDRIEVTAGEDFVLHVSNMDPLPEEFESKALHIEKVIAGHTDAKIRINGLEAGEYPFVGEFHEDEAKGTIFVK